MIQESLQFSKSCLWFSTLVAKQINLESIYYKLKKSKALDVKTIQMEQGNKTSRIVAWSFLSQEQRIDWMKKK